MTESPVLFLDSGIGGLPYLDWLVGARSDLPVAYIADTRYFPYGELSEDEVRSAVLETAGRAFGFLEPRLLVLACNTASVSALDELRAIAPCPVVGTVPAVKPAAAIDSPRPIGVLATEGTINSPYLDSLLQAFAPHREVRKKAAGDIVRFVEEQWLDEGDNGAEAVLGAALSDLKSLGVGSVVLGCTHFLHVTEAIGRMMGMDVALIDSREGVGRRILSLLGLEIQEAAESRAKGSFHVSESGESDHRYRRFAAIHGLEWMGSLP